MAFLKEVNLKYDMPTADLAVRRATWAIQNAKTTGAGALKLIHGYGSHGAWAVASAWRCAHTWSASARAASLRDVIPGERFSIFDEATRRAFLRCDELRRDADLDRANNGVTIVVL